MSWIIDLHHIWMKNFTAGTKTMVLHKTFTMRSNGEKNWSDTFSVHGVVPFIQNCSVVSPTRWARQCIVSIMNRIQSVIPSLGNSFVYFINYWLASYLDYEGNQHNRFCMTHLLWDPMVKKTEATLFLSTECIKLYNMHAEVQAFFQMLSSHCRAWDLST